MPDDGLRDPQTTPTFYFGYGSNMWIDQMNRRCTENKYIGITRLGLISLRPELMGWLLVITAKEPEPPIFIFYTTVLYLILHASTTENILFNLTTMKYCPKPCHQSESQIQRRFT
jgi:hypothetical protein